MHIRDRTQVDLQPCVDLLQAVHLANRDPTRWPDDPRAWLSPTGLLTALVAAEEIEVLMVVDDRSGTLTFYERQGWRFTGRSSTGWRLADGSQPTLAHFEYPYR